ncbi:MAG: hypothetical protein JST12_01915 [Armatimonadetes bacterium]|nr:hypothetical protein [Armatimonadota bacterium]
MAKKTWREKLNNGKQPAIEVLDKPYAGAGPGDRMLIPTPMQVDAYMRSIPKGEARTLQEMNKALATEAGADVSCPMCCGIFVRIASEAAHDELVEGKSESEVTPFWRMIPPKAPIRKKLTFDVGLVDRLRKEEGLPV